MMCERTRQFGPSSLAATEDLSDVGRWVEIEFIVSDSENRIVTVADTALLPLVGRVRGFTTGPVEIGDEVEVETLTGRRQRGTVIATEPGHHHSFGRTDVSVLSNVCRTVRGLTR